MISSLPVLSLAIWLAVTVSMLALSVVLALSRSSARYPSFSTLVYFTTCGSLVLLLVGWLASVWTYVWLYFAFDLTEDILIALVAWEVYRKMFGPAMALPVGAPRKIARSLLVAVISWATLGLLLRAAASKPYMGMALTGQHVLYGALAGAFCVLTLLPRRMGITVRRKVAGVVGGLAVLLTVNLVAAIVRDHTHGQMARSADDFSEVVTLLVYSFWAWCFLEKEQPVPTSAPPELVSALARELEALKSTTQVSTQV